MVLGCVLSLSTLGQEEPKTAASAVPENRQPAKVSPTMPGSLLRMVIEPLEYPAQAVVVPREQATTPPKVRLSPWSAEVQKLARAGIDDDVVLAFIDTAGTFNLTSDQIIQLRDQGVSGSVINAMMQHDSEIISGLRPVIASTVPNSDLLVQSGEVQKPLSLSSPAPVTDVLKNHSTAAPGTEGTSASAPSFEGPGWARAGDEIATTEASVVAQPREAPAPRTPLFPVREPYPVPITDPLIIIRGEPRIPNVQVLVWFAE